MRTSGIPSGIDDCGSLGVTECLVGDVGIWEGGAALEMPVAQRVRVVVFLGHSEGVFRLFDEDVAGTAVAVSDLLEYQHEPPKWGPYR